MNGMTFVLALGVLSAFMACAVDEVTSIVFASALIFQVCDTLKLRPTPFIIIAVLATNIGSAGTMLGNPVGILIGYKAGFTFGDFMVWAFPIMLVSLASALAILLVWYRREIAEMTDRMNARRAQSLGLGPLVQVPYRRGLAILVGTLGLIASHHHLEVGLGLEKNTVLIVAPLFVAGVLMLWRHQRARHYIEAEVEWWTLLFFMMLFAVAGTLEHTGVTHRIAEDFSRLFGGSAALLTPVIIGLSALGSAFVDNVVFVAACIPVVKELNATPLWWGLLFGACFGGNITMIGSTANIVALGMIEKRYRAQVRFIEWLRVGALVGFVSCLIAWLSLVALSPYMPARTAEPRPAVVATPAAH
jgi:Na+/H+ antiporter NhaD/arsenite permease-like protein